MVIEIALENVVFSTIKSNYQVGPLIGKEWNFSKSYFIWFCWRKLYKLSTCMILLCQKLICISWFNYVFRITTLFLSSSMFNRPRNWMYIIYYFYCSKRHFLISKACQLLYIFIKVKMFNGTYPIFHNTNKV